MLIIGLNELQGGQETRRIRFDDYEHEHRYQIVGGRHWLFAQAQQIHDHRATVEHAVHLVLRRPVGVQFGDLLLRCEEIRGEWRRLVGEFQREELPERQFARSLTCRPWALVVMKTRYLQVLVVRRYVLGQVLDVLMKDLVSMYVAYWVSLLVN